MSRSLASRGVPAAFRSRVGPLADIAPRTLCVPDTFTGLFPEGLHRGTTMVARGPAARSFVFALAAAACRAGSWLAVIDLGDPGWRGVAELGAPIERIVTVETRTGAGAGAGNGSGLGGGREAECIAAALDGFDVVLVGSRVRLGDNVERRLAARARERDAVLIGLHEPTPAGAGGRTAGPFSDVADVRVAIRGGRWEGLGAGSGHLVGRRVEIIGEGKRLPGRRRTTELWLPGPTGSVQAVADPVVPDGIPHGITDTGTGTGETAAVRGIRRSA